MDGDCDIYLYEGEGRFFTRVEQSAFFILGSLSKDSVLFWDEAEANMNPKMIKPMVDALIALNNMTPYKKYGMDLTRCRVTRGVYPASRTTFLRVAVTYGYPTECPTKCPY